MSEPLSITPLAMSQQLVANLLSQQAQCAHHAFAIQSAHIQIGYPCIRQYVRRQVKAEFLVCDGLRLFDKIRFMLQSGDTLQHGNDIGEAPLDVFLMVQQSSVFHLIG